MGQARVSESQARTWLMVVLIGVLLAGCGAGSEAGDEQAADAATEPDATPTSPGPQPDATQPEGSPSPSAAGTQASSGAFSGQSIEFVVPYEPGGGYDTYARMLAPELADCLGADVIVVNEPGAGGLLATNQTWTAPADGSRIQILNTIGVLGSDIADGPGVQYESADFSWIGRVTGEPGVVVTAANGEFQSFEDMLNTTADNPVTFVSTGPGSLELMDSTILMEVFGVPGRVVSGFAGGGEGFQAVVRGDADAQSRSLYSQLPHVESGEATPIIIMGSEEVEELPGVPSMLTVDVDTEVNQAVLEEHAALVESGRSLAAPPGMEPAALQELRDCYEATATDAEFAAAAQDQGRPIQFLSGGDVDALVDRVMGASPEYVEILRSAFAEGG